MQTNSLDSQALPSGTHLHEFVIERVIGSGGFGITYLARDTSLSRSVVIKENLPSQFAWRETSTGTVRPRHKTGSDIDDYDWSLKNFLREADTLASLDHPSIVRVLRKFEGNGTAYFVMPFVEGMTFDLLIGEHTGKGSAFEEAGLHGLLERVLDALDHLHQRGIYHRDIKPGNILITNEGLPVLIDFGSARQRLSERSMTVVESAGYTPFEQLQSRGNVGAWSDLYALGGTLEKALTGEAPPKAMDRMRNDPRVPLVDRTYLRERYSEAFLSHIDKALEVDEAMRWQTASEWGNALHGWTSIKHPNANPVQSNNQAHNTPNHIPILHDKRIRFYIGAIVLLTLFFAVYFTKLFNGEIGNQENAYTHTPAPLPQASDEVVNVQVKKAEEQARQEDEKRKWEEKNSHQAEGLYAGEQRDFEIAPGVKMTFCWCPPGEFMMGSPATEEGRDDDEDQVKVSISKGFWIGKTEVTQAQWLAVMGKNPSHFKGANLPVESVSWDEAQEFLQKIDPIFVATDGWKTMLPTEAQWEYAARAGKSLIYSGSNKLDEVAWYYKNSGSKTSIVGMQKANAWGMHDMSGNVWEWCRDWYDDELVSCVDPSGAISGTYRVFRGGSWCNFADNCRVAERDYNGPTFSYNLIGFRVVRSAAP